MARYIGPKCKLARREGTDLFLKSGVRSLDSKCKLEAAPGQHGARRGRLSDYGVQLREKQKVKRMYGLSEKQFHLFFGRADHLKGITGTNLLVSLERRFDNVVYRLGLVNSRTQGRHFVRHNHFLVNGKKVNIPSYLLNVGDVIDVREKSKNIQAITDSMDAVVRRGIPQWLDLEKENLKGTVKAFPVREDIAMPIQEQLIVELYSK